MTRRAAAGFTLVEIMIVLAVLALITAIALPRLTGTQAKAELQADTREIAAALRSTRSLAMAGGRSESFLVDTAAGVFRAPSAAAVRLAKGIRPILFTATQEQIGAATGGIRFFPDGSSTGGGVRLVQGNRQSEILVDWLTGRVSVAMH